MLPPGSGFMPALMIAALMRSPVSDRPAPGSQGRLLGLGSSIESNWWTRTSPAETATPFGPAVPQNLSPEGSLR